MQKFFAFYNSENLSEYSAIIDENFIQNFFFNSNGEFCIRFLKFTQFFSKFNGIFQFVYYYYFFLFIFLFLIFRKFSLLTMEHIINKLEHFFSINYIVSLFNLTNKTFINKY